MRSLPKTTFFVLALASSFAPACGPAKILPCGSNTAAVTLPGATDLAGATFTASDQCGAHVGSPNFVAVYRGTVGTCQVQVVLATGATYAFSVDFALGGTGRCSGTLMPVNASTPVLIDPGRCQGQAGGMAGGAGGGAAGASGGAGATGMGGAAGGGGTTFSPACKGLTTTVGIEPMRACGCTATDPQVCYEPCGPEGLGGRSETCTGGAYVEATLCSFDPARNYACYQVPTVAENTSCPPAASDGFKVAPPEGAPCTVDACVVCNSYGGLQGGTFVDVHGVTGSGYCVCTSPDAAGHRTWSCASDLDWPCPGNSGC